MDPARRAVTPAVVQSLALALLAAGLLGPAYWQGGIFAALDIMTVSLPWAALSGNPPWYNPLITDPATQYLPWRQFAYETLRGGQWPLWNPYLLAGHPTFGSINEQTFYPPNALLFFLPAEHSFGLLAWLHLTLAGVGARAFARLHVDDDAAAVLAGVATMLSGPMVAWLQYPALMSTIAWAGAIFFLLELTLRRGTAAPATFGGASIGMCLLAGMTQYALYLLALAAIYVAVRLPSRPATLRRLGLAALVGLGLGSVAYLPALEFAPLAHRGRLTLEQLAESALPVGHLALYVLPNAFGSPVRGDYIGGLNYLEATSYLGLLPLALTPLALVVRLPGRAVRTFAAASLALLLIQLGSAPALRLIERLPPFNYFVLNRVVMLLPFTLGLVAAAAYACLPTDDPRARRIRAGAIASATLGLAAAVVWAAGGQASRSGPDVFVWRDAGLALGLLVLGGAILAARVWLPRGSPAAWLAPIVLAVDLLLFGGAYNTVVAANPAAGSPPEPVARLPAGSMAPRAVGLQVERYVFGPNLGMLWRIPVPDGYVSQYLNGYRDFVGHATPEKPVPWLRLFTNMTTFSQLRGPYLDLLGVRYVLTTPDPLVPDALSAGGERFSESIHGGRAVGASFRARQHGLNRIDVYPRLIGGQPPPWLALHLKRQPDAAAHLSYVRIDRPAIEDGRPLTFYFNPIGDSAGQPFHFYLDAPEAGPDQAFALRAGADGAPRFDAYAVPLTGWQKVVEANGTALYENPAALPRAYLASAVRQLSDDAFYAALDDGSLDPRRTAAVHAPPPPGFQALVGMPPAEHASVEVVAADALTVELRTVLDRPALLVVANSWYDGWRARVDGAEAPVERVNAVLQGVYLAPGPHVVRLSFEPSSVRLGLALAVAALAVAGAALVWERRGGP